MNPVLASTTLRSSGCRQMCRRISTCYVIVATDGVNSAVGRIIGQPEIDPADLHVGLEWALPLPLLPVWG